jgi:hypothetical protein
VCEREKQAEYRDRNRERERARCRKYRLENLEKVRESKRRSAAKHREARRKAFREYYQKNKEICHRSSRRYRARKVGAEDPSACPETIDKIYALCEALNKRSKRKGGWSVDHTTPLAKGGTHHEENLQVVPSAWNCRKGDRHRERWPGKYPKWVHDFCVDIGLSLD